MADFKIIRGSTVIGSGNATAQITESTEYTLEGGVDATSAFIRIVSSRLTGGGKTASGGNQNCDDVYVYVTNPANIGTSITFGRRGTANNCRVSWEIIQYIGAASGANEIIVRAQEVLTHTAAGTQVTGTTITTIVDNADVVVFLTGQDTEETGRQNPQTGESTTSLTAVSSDWAPRANRGYSGGGADISRVSVAVVEFVGSNWSVFREEFTSATHGATVWTTGSPNNSGTQNYTTAIADASKTFLHNQYRNANTGSAGNDDSWEIVEVNGTTSMTTRRSVASGGTNKSLVTWGVENSQSDSGAMSVEHRSEHRSSSGTEELTTPITVTTVSALDETSIMGECSSALGTGSGTPRGHGSLEMTTTSNVDIVESETSVEVRTSFSVVQWPAEVSGNVDVAAIAAGTAINAPAIAADQPVTVAAIPAGTEILAPSALQAGDVPAIPTGTAILAPQVDRTVDVAAIAAGTEITATTIFGEQVRPITSAIPAGTAILAPQVDQTVNVDAVPAGTDVPAPTVRFDQSVTVAAIAAGTEVLAPSITQTVSVPVAAIAAGTEVLAPGLDKTVPVAAVPASAAVIAPDVQFDQQVVVAVVPAGTAIPTPTVDTGQLVSVGAIAASTEINAPAVVPDQFVSVSEIAASAVTVDPDRVDQTVDVAAEAASAIVVTADRVDQTVSVSAIPASAVVVLPDRIDQTVDVGAIPSGTTIVVPGLTIDQIVSAAAITAGTAIIAPTPTFAAVTISFALTASRTETFALSASRVTILGLNASRTETQALQASS